ncbi:TPA: DUF3784 domain-containing protein [Methanosarcinaceae archaeon]|nr:DUF3784 domain-containing protein [Methanosarcinaceae archaeon]
METLSLIRLIYGIFFILLGIVFWRLKPVNILAGYDDKKVLDKEGLAKWISGNLLLTGLLIILNVSLEIVGSNPVEKSVLLDFLIIFAMAVLTALGTGRYEKKRT